MLVEQARDYHDAVLAVFDSVKTLDYVGPSVVEAIPWLGRIMLLANRRGLTDAQVTDRMGDIDQLRALATEGARSTETDVALAALLILRWLDEPDLVERAAKYMTLFNGLHALRLLQP